MIHLLDTNIISELARPRPDPAVLQWAEGISRIALSVVTLEELSYGLSWRPNARIQVWLDGFLEYYCDLLPVGPEIARLAGELRGQLQGRGIVRTQADMLIAATAAVHGLTLVTRNEKDFFDCGVALLNPFGGKTDL